jgi:hypothetical protein
MQMKLWAAMKLIEAIDEIVGMGHQLVIVTGHVVQVDEGQHRLVQEHRVTHIVIVITATTIDDRRKNATDHHIETLLLYQQMVAPVALFPYGIQMLIN